MPPRSLGSSSVLASRQAALQQILPPPGSICSHRQLAHKQQQRAAATAPAAAAAASSSGRTGKAQQQQTPASISDDASKQEESEQQPQQLPELQLQLPEPTNIQVKTAEFTKSSVKVGDCPPAKYPEFAVIGRSNVGKSSLINMLTNRKSLAMVSKQPGECHVSCARQGLCCAVQRTCAYNLAVEAACSCNCMPSMNLPACHDAVGTHVLPRM
jgi:ATPase subunit of ABC transporter with duplicated ATPase domains